MMLAFILSIFTARKVRREKKRRAKQAAARWLIL